jgi:hypothetical protein
MKKLLLFAVMLLALSGALLYAQQEQPQQQQPPPSDKYVSREEYEKLKSELDEVKAQMAELMKNVAPKPVSQTGTSKVKRRSPKHKTPEVAGGLVAAERLQNELRQGEKSQPMRTLFLQF